MRALLLVACVLLTGCAATAGDPINSATYIHYYHDEDRGVGCWVVVGGLSCLPDSEYRQ